MAEAVETTSDMCSTVGIVFYLGQEKLTLGEGNFAALPLSTLWAAVDLN